jgi:hypothetical protein
MGQEELTPRNEEDMMLECPRAATEQMDRLLNPPVLRARLLWEDQSAYNRSV